MTERKRRADAPKQRPKNARSKAPEAPAGWLTVPEHDAENDRERQP